MAINRDLAKQRGLCEEDIANIEALHDDCDTILREYVASGRDNLQINLDLLKKFEFRLQHLWGFPPDERYHTRGILLKNIHLQQEWVGRTFECIESGVRATVSEGNVSEGALFLVGNGFIDFGRAGAYHRIGGNIREVSNVDG